MHFTRYPMQQRPDSLATLRAEKEKLKNHLQMNDSAAHANASAQSTDWFGETISALFGHPPQKEKSYAGEMIQRLFGGLAKTTPAWATLAEAALVVGLGVFSKYRSATNKK